MSRWPRRGREERTHRVVSEASVGSTQLSSRPAPIPALLEGSPRAGFNSLELALASTEHGETWQRLRAPLVGRITTESFGV